MKIIKMDENLSRMAEEILIDLKASPHMGLLKCMQCGMCTSMCPGARHTDYDPREMIKRVLINDETVIDDELIWNCFYCYTCHSICPVNNSACEVNQILRQISIKKGEGIKKIIFFYAYGESFLELGVGSIPSELFNDLIKDVGEEYFQLKINLEDIREELGLKSAALPKRDVEDINKILDKSGFKSRLKMIKRWKDEINTR
ncbi:MAG: hypothetical protein Kow0019_16600 [Methanobacteriaceae archaeon]